jgi:hypothetical protein
MINMIELEFYWSILLNIKLIIWKHSKLCEVMNFEKYNFCDKENAVKLLLSSCLVLALKIN